MVVVFVTVWRQSLQSELERLRRDPLWRVLASAVVVAGLIASGLLSVRVVRAYASARPVTRTAGGGWRTVLDVEPPRTHLVDQTGQRVSLTDFRGQTVLLTFAFGHCTTVCPTIVNDLLAARRAAGRTGVRLVVLTLDPWRDTPERLPYLAEHWGLSPGDRVLSGSVSDVEAALTSLRVARGRNVTTGTIDHTATVMMLDESGRLAWRIDGWTGGARLVFQ
jgi:protein SCO1/2